MQEPSLIGYRGESLLGKKMILRSTSLFREKKSENSYSVQKSSARKRALFLRFSNLRLSLSSKSLMLKRGMPWLVLGQHFFPESLKSRGIKEVRVVWADGA